MCRGHSRLETFLFSKSFPHSHLFLAEAHLLEFDNSAFGPGRGLAVTGAAVVLVTAAD